MNTRYYLDTEFNSFGGSLISVGICRHDDPADNLYLVVPKPDIDAMREAEGMDPWIETNVIANLFAIPSNVNVDIFPVSEWGPIIGAFIYREGEIPQIMVDWPSDAMDFAKLLMTGPGQAVPMGNQTHISILRHIDVYPTTLEGAVQHNAIWDAMAIRQLLVDLEAKPQRKPDPIQQLGRPTRHKAETQAAIQRLGDEFHKTRVSHHVCVEPGDLKLALEALGYYE